MSLGSSQKLQWGDAATYITGSNSGDFLQFYPDGNVQLTLNSSGATIEDNLTVGGTATVTSWLYPNNGISIPDSKKILLGNQSDLQIYHDGSHSYVSDVGTGHLRLTGTNVLIEDGAGTDYIYAASNAVTLYNAGNIRLQTQSTGVSVTGNLTASGHVSSETIRSSRSDGDVYIQATGTSDFVSIGNQTTANILKVESTGATVTGNLSVIYNGSASVRTYNGVLKSDFLENSAGANHLTIRTESGGNKNVIIDPDGTGITQI
jgi:hypothetical protein